MDITGLFFDTLNIIQKPTLNGEERNVDTNAFQWLTLLLLFLPRLFLLPLLFLLVVLVVIIVGRRVVSAHKHG